MCPSSGKIAVLMHINAVASPDNGHTVVRNMYRKEINILRKMVHQAGFIYEIIYRCTIDRTYTLEDNTVAQFLSNFLAFRELNCSLPCAW
jgi:ABC-type polar amino acid transport system ATPase subunit